MSEVRTYEDNVLATPAPRKIVKTFIKHDLTIIIPVFNEEQNLARVEKELTAFINTAEIETTVLFIDDGSTDNSAQMIEDICIKNPAFTFICFERNYGLSAAIKA